jgi:hypothetical protein
VDGEVDKDGNYLVKIDRDRFFRVEANLSDLASRLGALDTRLTDLQVRVEAALFADPEMKLSRMAALESELDRLVATLSASYSLNFKRKGQ